MKFEIRSANHTDFEQVGNIFTEENRFHAELVPEIIRVADPIMTREWYGEVLHNPNKRLFVAVYESEIIGLTLAEIRNSLDDPIFTHRKFVYIDEIAVAASHRSRGVGRALMDQVHQWAAEQSIAEIELQVWERNTNAIGFYQQLGYQPWRRTMRLRLETS